MKFSYILKKQVTGICIFLFCLFCIFSAYSQNYDGNCPAGATSYTDCDCAPDGMTNFQAVNIKDTSDYANVVYIDPTANDPNENGSFAHPYNSWFDITWTTNTAYVQKRGTTFSSSVTIVTTASNIMLGAYGSGDMPIIMGTSTSNRTLNVESAYVLLRDLSFQAPNLNGTGAVLYLRGASNYVIVYQCDICNSGWEGIMAYSDYGHIIGCNIYNIEQDAIWLSQTPYFEIAYNNIYDFNQSWYPGAPESVSSGDGIQAEYNFEQIWIHHNTIDHGSTGNKQTILLSSNTGYDYTCNRAIVEFNTIISPKVTAEGGGAINHNQGNNHTVRYNKIYAAEVIAGSYPDSISVGIYTTGKYDSIYGNTFVDFNEAIHASTGNQILVANNTFFNTQDYIFTGTSAHSKFYNNIIDQNLFSGVTIDAESNNMFVSGTPWTNSFTGDPDYVNAGNNNFQLQSSSDAIDAGTSLAFYKYDIQLNQVSGTVDVGAYQYTGTTAPPSAPINLHVTDSTSSSISIAWTDTISNEDQFIIERSSGAGFSVIDYVSENVTSYTNTGLISNTTYSYRVKARNTGGDSGYSNTVSGTTLPDTSGTVRNVAIGKTATQSTTALSATANKAVDNNTDGIWTNGSVATTQYEDYPWWQVDLDSVFSIQSIDIWNRTDCCADRLDNIYVFVSENAFTSTDIASTIAQSGVNSYYLDDYATSDTSITIGQDGRYVRIQSTIADTYINLAEVKVWGASGGGSVPNAPSGLAATDSTATSITLEWIDNASTEDMFIIERSFLSGSGFAVIDSVGTDTTSYTDTGLTPDTTYFYRVKAKNSFGESSYSNVESVTTSGSTPVRNVAIGKTATQISTAYNATANRAVDNNTDGIWTNGSVATTQYENYPWWQVDLDSVFSIQSIDIWNRTDCCADRLDNIYVFVSENAFTSTDIAATIAQSGVNSYYLDDYATSDTSITIGQDGRYVRIQSTIADTYINLAEVKVWGASGGGSAPNAPSGLTVTDSTATSITLEWTDNASTEDMFMIERSFFSGSGFAVIDSVGTDTTSYTDTGLTPDTTYFYRVKAKNSFGESAYSNTLEANTNTVNITNVALSKTATQSSTYAGGVASRAVDGNTDGTFSNGSVTHTDNETNAWWQVDLGDDYQVTSIEVWNRTDACCMDRLDNYYVMLADTFTSTNLSTAIAQSTWYEQKTTYPNSTHYFYPDTTGHHVRVQLGDTNNLSLAEVIVWGYDASLKQAVLSEKINSEKQTDELITVYPNPGSNTITISGFDRAQEIMMVDMLGKVVFQTGKANNSKQINVSNLKKGLYLIVLKTEHNYHMKKFIKN